MKLSPRLFFASLFSFATILVILSYFTLYSVSISGPEYGKKIATKHIGPDYLYPNLKLTPGKAETSNLADLLKLYNGQTYSQSHRNVPQSVKNQVCQEYSDNCKGKVEIDHFAPPLCAGGSNDITNLWAQPEHNIWNGQDWGFHTKDKLETRICALIKQGTLDPKIAAQKMANDWVAYYKEIFGNDLGGVDNSLDEVE